MIAALEQSGPDLAHLVQIAQGGQEVVLTKEGKAVAKITAMRDPSWPRMRDEWLDDLQRLRDSVGTRKTDGPTTEQILDDLRADRC